MDYTTQHLGFRLKKLVRYIRLYGPSRTAMKVRAQYHMKRKFERLPAIPRTPRVGPHVGLLGCGNFAFSTIAYYLIKNWGYVIQGAMDTDVNRAASLFRSYRLNYYTGDPEQLFTDPAIDLLFIASNHASHAEYAIRALECGKNVHIEKPHVVSEDQLVRLCTTMATSSAKVTLGFNRPKSKIGRLIKRHLDVQHGPGVYNWFIAGHEIPKDHWYFKKEEGGRVLGNLCHWTDFVYHLVPKEVRYPITINPTRSAKSDCDIAVTFVFGDGSLAVLTFSAKGHIFEGVSEHFSAHRGNVLLTMDNFQTLTVKCIDKTDGLYQRYRDHGHADAIRESYEMARLGQVRSVGCSIEYVWETGQLFLKSKEALEQNQSVTLSSYKEAWHEASSSYESPTGQCDTRSL